MQGTTPQRVFGNASHDGGGHDAANGDDAFWNAVWISDADGGRRSRSERRQTGAGYRRRGALEEADGF